MGESSLAATICHALRAYLLHYGHYPSTRELHYQLGCGLLPAIGPRTGLALDKSLQTCYVAS